MTEKIVMGVYDDEEAVLNALRKVKESEFEADDVYSPFPIHGIGDLLDIKRSRLTYVCFAAGLLGGIFALTGMGYLNVMDWPTVIGGKPFFAFPAYIPIIFEFAILSGALVTAGAFFYRSGLFPGNKGNIIHAGVTDDKFVITINSKSDRVSAAQELLKGTGASQVGIIGA
ncbi:MAG: DUF3341 domain-containing protein [SAR324 cluster bacterium]|nr:DUF3341 domain-containing protein [SAR324 cluster bacterium]